MEIDELNEEGDEIATIEYQNIESEGITALTRQLEVRSCGTSCDLKQDQTLVQLSIVVVKDIICKCYQ